MKKLFDTAPLLNTLHAVFHWRSHIDGSNDTWVRGIIKQLTTRKIKHVVLFTWCPVCTLTALWRWLIMGESTYE